MTQIWWGKLAGAAVGLAAGGWLGAVLGVLLGHQFDLGLSREMGRKARAAPGGDTRKVQVEFFATTFSVMGHLSKADGRVSEDEINAARQVMHRMNLSPEQVQAAIRLFNEGKRPDFPLAQVMGKFRRICRRHHDLLRAFIEIQLQAALADGAIHSEQRQVLWQICAELGISRVEFVQMEALARLHGKPRAGRVAPRTHDRLAEAYGVLGVAADDTDAVIKKAYRRLMSQHHPDKLVSRGLPEEMMQMAQEKVREIRAAYDQVKEARGL